MNRVEDGAAWCETHVPALLRLGGDSQVLNVTGADDAESAALLLTTMHRLHKQLDDFTTQLYIAYDFGDASGLVPAILIEKHAGGPELRIRHRFLASSRRAIRMSASCGSRQV